MDQKTALKALKLGYNIFLTGPAGSGKTFVLNKFISWLEENYVPAAVTASTGIAATHLNGITIHAWSGMGIKDSLGDRSLNKIIRRRKVYDRLRNIKVLIIDEISMLHAYQLDLVDKICRFARESELPFGGLQVVLCGDFFQLPPVRRDTDLPAKFVFESKAWREMHLEVCYLDEQHRHSNPVLIDLLNNIRLNSVKPESHKVLESRLNKRQESVKSTKLYTHNHDVDRENSWQLSKLAGKAFCYTMQKQGNKKLTESLANGCLAPEKLYLKVGALVMFVKNNFDIGYVNGTVGTIVDFDKESKLPIVKTNKGVKIKAGPETWVIGDNGEVLAAIRQIPLRLAWAITVHKSQGMSLDAAEIDLSRSFEYGMGYVALSRVRSLEGLSLLGFNAQALTVNPEILTFDKTLKDISDDFTVRLSKLELPPEKKEKPICPIPKPKKLDKEKAYSVDKIRQNFPQAYAPWKEADDKLLLKLKEKGWTIGQLAQRFKRKKGAISSRLKKLEVE